MADLKGRSVRGGAITVFSQSFRFVIQTGSTVVLARLLTPADFGLIAMVTAITNFATMFKELGLSAATVQKAEINHDQISTLFWINVGFGVLIAAAVVGLAPAVAWFYDDPRLTPLTMALGAPFIFGGLAVQHHAMLQRHMRFFAIGVVEVISMAVGVAAAVVAGVLGAGYWSLVIMQVAMAAAAAVGRWIAFPWLPGRPRRGVGTREMLRFGGNITGFNIVNYFSRNADNVLIGKFLGTTALGFYSKAYTLLMLPISQIREPLERVAMPALSRIQGDPKKYLAYYKKLVSLLAFISMPLAVLLAIFSTPVIRLLLGEQWLDASNIFKVLAITAFIQPVASTRGLVLISLGQSQRYFKWGLFNALLVVFSFTVGIRWGAIGVAAAYGIANYAILFPSLWYCFKMSPISIGDFVQALIRPIIATLAMGLVVFFVYRSVASSSAVLTLGLGLAVGFFVYFLAWALMPGGLSFLREIYSYCRLLFQKQTQANSAEFT